MKENIKDWEERQSNEIVVIGGNEGNLKEVAGKLVGFRKGKYSNTLYEIEEEDTGNILVVACGMVAEGKLRDEDIGKTVRFKYNKDIKGKSGRFYKDISILVKK